VAVPRFVHLLIWLCLPGLAWAQVPAADAPLSLAEVVRRVIERDPGARAAQVRLRELKASADAAQGAFDLVGDFRLDGSSERLTARDREGRKTPLDTTRLTLDASLIQPLVWGTRITAGWTHRFTETDNPFRNCVPGVASEQCFESRLILSVTQPLMRGRGRAINDVAAERVDAQARVARAERAATLSTVIETIQIACAELAFAEADVVIQARGLALAEAQLDVSKKRIRGRQMAPVEIAVVEQAVAERAQAVFVAEQRVAERRAELALRLGVDEMPPIALDAPEPWPADVATTRAQAANAHPQLAVLAAQIEAQKQAIVVQEDAVRPQLDLGLTAAQTGLDETLSGAIAALPDNESAFYGVNLAFTFPFANRRAEGELAAARQAIERAKLQREAQAQSVRLSADSALRALRTAEEAQRLAEKVVSLAERSLDAEQKRLKLGRATNLDVLRVQQDVATAALSVARAETDARVARARLDRLTGEGLARFGVE
jgi:outer membrane protein TolC